MSVCAMQEVSQASRGEGGGVGMRQREDAYSVEVHLPFTSGIGWSASATKTHMFTFTHVSPLVYS